MKNDNELELLLEQASLRRPPEAGLVPVEQMQREFLRRAGAEMTGPPWWSYALRLAALFAVAALVVAALWIRTEITNAQPGTSEFRLPPWRLEYCQTIASIYDNNWFMEK